MNATDRCDRCGARACVRVTLTESRLELLFCAHHARVNMKALAEVGCTVEDESAVTPA
jgi:hypothetical protein